MVPFLALILVTALAMVLGALGADAVGSLHGSLRAGLVALFLLTGSAHFGPPRGSLIRMVPPMLPNAPALVTVTGILEILGAVLLLIPATAPVAAVGLIGLLVAVFPANVHASRAALHVAGRRTSPLPVRAGMQAVFIAALIGAIG